ncbi:hypothetical protein AMTR_s00140p00055140 [Amborella trichopoda]|uniref:K Homology domain-containing protein n=2 Tax=Amborella trichopoda TaxID=13333 RepID=W1PCL2_AMBTC|nr:hypothetical protein AMTR_s00140p00055140 [Amborella trichopoda]
MDHHPESPDSPSYVSSPDVSHKRSTTTKPTSPDNKEKPASVRFLVSNAAAGSVIGKGGSTITEFQSQSGARFQLSRNHEYFPGTTDRIIMISGTVDEILTAMDFILSKLQSELHIEDGDDVDPRLKLRLIVPNSSCGGIIGKAGSTIKYDLLHVFHSWPKSCFVPAISEENDMNLRTLFFYFHFVFT